MKYVARPVVVDAMTITAVAPSTVESGAVACTLDGGPTVIADAAMCFRYTPKQGDYWVVQSDDYEYINPKEVFERKYAPYGPLDGMNFGKAIELLKQGVRVARAGWNGKGMWLEFVAADKWSTSIGPCHHAVPGAYRLPWIAMKTVDNGLVPWLASQTDMLAEDWCLVL